MSPEVARATLQICFAKSDTDRMNELAALAREGHLNRDQREELDRYNRVGHLLAMLHSEARRAIDDQQGR